MGPVGWAPPTVGAAAGITNSATRFGGRWMSEVHPTVRYLIVCEDVQTDPNNPRRVTLVSLLSAIRSLDQPPFPLLYREICVFLQLTECRGSADGRIEIQHADSGQVV